MSKNAFHKRTVVGSGAAREAEASARDTMAAKGNMMMVIVRK
jgi:hypothetical protein